MSPIIWIPKKDFEIHGGKTIRTISARAYPAKKVSIGGRNAKSKGKPTTHWVFSCTLSENTSICFDPSPPEPDAFSKEAIKVIQLDPIGLTVKGFVDLLQSLKYDKHQFSIPDLGCKYWIDSVVTLLQSKGYLDFETQVTSVTEALGKLWARNGLEQTGMQQRDRFWELE